MACCRLGNSNVGHWRRGHSLVGLSADMALDRVSWLGCSIARAARAARADLLQPPRIRLDMSDHPGSY